MKGAVALKALVAGVMVFCAGLVSHEFSSYRDSYDNAPRVEIQGGAFSGSHIEIDVCEDTGALDVLDALKGVIRR